MTEDKQLEAARKYWHDLAIDIIENPTVGDFYEDKLQLANWLHELQEYRAANNYLVLQYNVDDGVDVAIDTFKMVADKLDNDKITIIALPNTTSLIKMSKEELVEFYHRLGKELGEE